MKRIFMAFVVGVAALVCTANMKAQTTGVINVMNEGAKCDGTTDDSAAFIAAATTGDAILVPYNVTCLIATSVILNAPMIFQPGSMIAANPAAVTVTINGSVSAPMGAQVFGGAGKVVANAPWVSVAWWGALALGVDPAPAFQAAMGSNRVVYIPAGSYTFESDQSAPLPATDNVGVLVQNVTNLDIEGYGATITMADSVAFSTDFLFYGATNLGVHGLTFAGNRTGLSSSQENAALDLESVVNFSVNDIQLTGNWGGISTAVAGDWLVNGTFRNFNMGAVGQCFDVAFLKNVAFDNFQAIGADANGNQGAGQVGNKCVSVIYDTPLVNYNNTGVSYNDTNGVVISRGSVSNFASGALIGSGQNYFFHNNIWSNNPGFAPNSPGLGIFIAYFNGGSASSIGHPPGDITINGDQFLGNGGAVAGAGIDIGNASITNTDVISGVAVINSIFNNNINTGVTATGTNNLTNVVLFGNLFEGANQTVAVGANLTGLAQTCPAQ